MMKEAARGALILMILSLNSAWADPVERELLQGRLQGLAMPVLVQGEGIELNHSTYFVGNTTMHGAELWRIDGGTGAAGLVRDIYPGPASAAPFALTAVGDRLYFQAGNAHSGRELWTSDGTAAGTYLVRDIAPGMMSSSPNYLTAAGGQLFFGAYEAATGMELWTSDGTFAGTRLVADIAQGNHSSFPAHLQVFGNRLFFRAFTFDRGSELWAYDLAYDSLSVQDLVAGAPGSSPHHFHVFGSQLFFRSQNNDGSLALWTLTADNPIARPLRDNEPGRVRLKWQLPLANEDGSPLQDLVGYRIYFGKEATRLSRWVAVADASALAHTLQYLPPGRHYFAITALSAGGGESVLSRTLSWLVL